MDIETRTSFLSHSYAKVFKDQLGFARYMQVSHSVFGYLTSRLSWNRGAVARALEPPALNLK